MKSNSPLLLAVSILFILLTGCQQSNKVDTRLADEQTIREARDKWTKAYEKKDLEKPLSFISDEAKMFTPNMPILDGKEAIRKSIAYMFSLPGFNLAFNVTKVDVAQAGDLAYETGTYHLTLNDEQGKPTTTPGKYVVVWKKQPDGKWKVVADIFNADK